jgi:hypothetical protein
MNSLLKLGMHCDFHNAQCISGKVGRVTSLLPAGACILNLPERKRVLLGI